MKKLISFALIAFLFAIGAQSSFADCDVHTTKAKCKKDTNCYWASAAPAACLRVCETVRNKNECPFHCRLIEGFCKTSCHNITAEVQCKKRSDCKWQEDKCGTKPKM